MNLETEIQVEKFVILKNELALYGPILQYYANLFLTLLCHFVFDLTSVSQAVVWPNGLQ